MFSLDMRTALFSFLLISVISTLLLSLLARQFSKRYNGINHLFWGFLLQSVSLLLILCRGRIIDWLSIDLANFLSIGGIILFLVGIEKYAGQKSSLKPNLLLLVVFITVHSWFTIIKPDLSIRHLNVSVAWLLLFLQATLLLIRRQGSGINRMMPLTVVCITFCVLCCVRIIKFFAWGHSDDYLNSDVFDIIIIIISQVLLVLLIFSIAYMFGGRLFDDIKSEEEKFSKIFHTAPYSIILSRLSDGKILEVNRFFHEITGYSYLDVIGKTTLEIGLWPEIEDRATLISELVMNDKISGKDFLIRTRSGEIKPGLINCELVKINNEICIFSSFEDITERKKIESEKDELFKNLADSEERSRAFFLNSLDANFLTNPNGEIFSANQAACDMVGRSESEICSAGRNGIVNTNDPRLEGALAERKLKGKYYGELTMVRKNGEIFPVELSSVIFKCKDGKEMTSMIVRDISERKQTEKKLIEASYYTRNLIEASLDPFMTISIDGKITDVNISAEKVTGKSRAELIGSNFRDYFTEPEKAEYGYLTAFNNGMVRDYPLKIKHSEGTSVPVLFNATVYRNESGQVNGVFAIARDITEILKTEEDLRKSKKMLEKLNQHIVDVRENERKNIAMALHDDLGQMLTGLCLDIAWLRKKLSGQPDTIVKKIDQLNETLEETIDTVKETSSLLRPVMLAELGLIPAMKTHLRKTGVQSGIKFSFSHNNESEALNNNISLVVYRILQEAVTNIVRHSGSSKAEVSLNVSSQKIWLTIQDFGKGITGEQINSLSSMGIAGMKERIRSVNGKINFKGENGKGTLISVNIPINSNNYDQNINN